MFLVDNAPDTDWSETPMRLSWLEPALVLLLGVVAAAGHVRFGSDPIVWLVEFITFVGGALAGRFPRAGALMVLMGLVLYRAMPPAWATMGQLVVMVVVFSLGLRRRRWVALAFMGVALPLLWWPTQGDVGGSGSWVDLVFWLVVCSLAYVVAYAFRSLSRAFRLTQRANQIEERAAIARNLHDTVAHRLAVLSIRAQRAQLSTSDTENDLAFIVAEADACVQEMRQILGLLHSPASTVDPPVGLATTVSEAVTRLREAGFVATVDVEGLRGGVGAVVPVEVQQCAREAINNIIKHADPGAACQIRVEINEAEVGLSFVNPMPRDVRDLPVPTSRGFGLEGINERIDRCGGSLRAGARGGRWRTHMVFPLNGHALPPAGAVHG